MVARIKVDTSDLERFARQFGEQGAKQIKYATPWIRKSVFVAAARSSSLEATAQWMRERVAALPPIETAPVGQRMQRTPTRRTR